MSLRSQSLLMHCSSVTLGLPSRDRTLTLPLGRCHRLWLPCGTVLEKSKSRCIIGKLKLPRKSISRR
ncbi:hypothetical protein LEMLEM_LOCUS23527 [Lemmus lemmus]